MQRHLAHHGEDLRVTTRKIWVVMCPDATHLWRTSLTKCEVFVHCWDEGIRPGGGDAAGPRTPTTPPPPRGLRPTVSCQRYEPKEPTGAEGAEGAQWGYVATLPTCGPFSDSALRSEALGIP